MVDKVVKNFKLVVKPDALLMLMCLYSIPVNKRGRNNEDFQRRTIQDKSARPIPWAMSCTNRVGRLRRP